MLRRGRGWPGRALVDAGDAPNDPGWAHDPDPRAKNRALICAYLPRLATHVHDALAGAGPDARLLLLGGDCTSHAGAMAGLRRARPAARFAIAWFDAHGDFNTPDTTPSGNVWGMPFAMIVGRGDPDLLAACDAPTVDAGDAALLGGQVLDETESRMLAASRVAHFGAGMLGTDAGLAALGGLGAGGRDRGRRVLRRVRHGRPRCLGRLGAGDAGAGRDLARDGRPRGPHDRCRGSRRGVRGDGDPHRAAGGDSGSRTADARGRGLAEAALGDGRADDPRTLACQHRRRTGTRVGQLEALDAAASAAPIARKSSSERPTPVARQDGFAPRSTSSTSPFARRPSSPSRSPNRRRPDDRVAGAQASTSAPAQTFPSTTERWASPGPR